MTKLNTKIQSGSRVTLHFSLALEDGQLIDSNFEKPAATMILGEGKMLAGFEEQLVGHQAGDEIDSLLPAERAFGERNSKNVQHFNVEKFRHLLEDELLPATVGAVVNFKDPGGFDLPGVVVEIDDQLVKIDFNHPLAGKPIRFNAKIVSVLPPDMKVVEIQV